MVTSSHTHTQYWVHHRYNIHQRSQNLGHLYPSIGLNWGFFRLFLAIKIAAVCQVRVSLLYLLWSEHEDKTHVNCCMASTDRRHIGFAFVFACVHGMMARTPKTSKLGPMADDAITWGRKEDLGSLVYIYGVHATIGPIYKSGY